MKYFFIFILSIISLPFILDDGEVFFLFSVILSMYTLLSTENKNLLHQMIGIAYVMFILYPYIILFYLGWRGENFYIFYLIHFYFFIFFLSFTQRINFNYKKIIDTNIKNKKIKYYLLCSILIIMLFVTNGDPNFFIAGLAIILLYMLKFMDKFKLKHLFFYSIPYLAYILLYSIFFWSGFGRLVFAGNIAFPILYWFKYSKFTLRNNVIFIFTIIIGSLMSLLRFKDESLNIELLLKDSALGPFALSYGIFSSRDNYQFDVSGLLEQFQLMFFAFIPRWLWVDKPIGFGRLYVDREMNTEIFSDSHSIAALIFGDYYFFLSEYWILGVIAISIFIVALFRYLNNKLVIFNHIALIYLPTLIWGGMASFGARFSMGAAAILIFIIFEKILLNLKGNK
ncbi:hypothetical protein [Pasteurella sp. PK-2025]|uniref:hypothetical protein n=1 Tax=Pasteurella sp. PK-2025 TaxID=3413133 RepID=UPI003C786B36